MKGDNRSGSRSRRPAVARGAFAGLLAALLAAAPAAAGELSVEAAAAGGGGFGLELEPGVGCAMATNTVGPGDVLGNRDACDTLTSAPGNEPATRVISPGANFLAGARIRLVTEFIVDPGALFSARLNPFIGSPFAYLTDQSPAAETDFWAFYRLNLDPFSLALGDDIGQLVGYDAGGAVQFRLILRRNASPAENRIVLQARDGGGLVEHEVGLPLAAGFNIVSVWWQSAAAAGRFLASVDGSPLAGLEGLDNGSGRIDSVRLGVVDGNPDLSSGSFYIDDYSSFRTLAP